MQTLSDLYKTEKELKKELVLTRIVIFEKCKPYDFKNNGLKYWYDKNGKVIRIDNDDSSLDMTQFIAFKGESFLEAGYVYAPYIPVMATQTIVESSFLPSEKIKSRYAMTQINSNLYSTITFGNLPAL
jgi:hypothetical protein